MSSLAILLIVLIILIIVIIILYYVFRKAWTAPAIPKPDISLCPEVNVYENKDISGFDILKEKDITQKECFDKCVSNDKCLMYNYKDKDKECTLKSGKYEANFLTGFKNIEKKKGCPDYSETLSVNLPVLNIESLKPYNNYTNKECQGQCDINKDCNFYAYNYVDKICYLKKMEDQPGTSLGVPFTLSNLNSI